MCTSHSMINFRSLPRFIPNVDESFEVVSRRLHGFMRSSTSVACMRVRCEIRLWGNVNHYFNNEPADELIR